MRILAIDPAANTGFAHSNGKYGVWRITHPRDNHAGDRLARLRTHLIEAFEAWGFERLAYEEASLGSHHIATIALHNRLAGVIELTAQQLGVELVPVNPSSLKKFATDNGRAKKYQMIRAAKTFLGIDTLSDDVADALWVLEVAKQPGGVPAAARVERKRETARRRKESKLF